MGDALRGDTDNEYSTPLLHLFCTLAVRYSCQTDKVKSVFADQLMIHNATVQGNSLSHGQRQAELPWDTLNIGV